MSPYQVILSPSAEKELERLPKKAIQRIMEALDGLAENPRPHGCLKLQGKENSYRIRVGVYPAIYEIHD